MSSRPTVLLVGEGITTLSALEALLPDFDVVGLVRSAEPGDPVVGLAERNAVPVSSQLAIRDIEAFVNARDPDLVVVSSYSRILPARMVQQRPYINVHYAPLPRYRGRATVNWAIINGEDSTAISIHSLEPSLDAGGILFQQAVPIGPRDTVATLYEQLNSIQRTALASAVWRRLGGDRGVEQDEELATYVCTRLPEDGEIDWELPAVSIDRLVRALVPPFPGAFTWLGDLRIVVTSCETVSTVRFEGRVPGRVVRISRDDGTVDVLAGEDVVRLHGISALGTPYRPAELIRSVRSTLGRRAAFQSGALLPQPVDAPTVRPVPAGRGAGVRMEERHDATRD
jgi:methionyl-tRNA formyltransferase